MMLHFSIVSGFLLVNCDLLVILKLLINLKFLNNLPKTLGQRHHFQRKRLIHLQGTLSNQDVALANNTIGNSILGAGGLAWLLAIKELLNQLLHHWVLGGIAHQHAIWVVCVQYLRFGAPPMLLVAASRVKLLPPNCLHQTDSLMLATNNVTPIHTTKCSLFLYRDLLPTRCCSSNISGLKSLTDNRTPMISSRESGATAPNSILLQSLMQLSHWREGLPTKSRRGRKQ